MVVGNDMLCRSMRSGGGEGGSCEQTRMDDDELAHDDEGAKGGRMVEVAHCL